MELRLSTTSAKLLDSEVKAAALPPPSLLSQRQSARFVVRDAPRPLRFRPRHLSTRADWQRLTRRSGPGATAQTKLVRLGRGPLVLNPSVGRRFSAPRGVGGVGVLVFVVRCATSMYGGPCCGIARGTFHAGDVPITYESKHAEQRRSICACLCEAEHQKGGK